MTNDVTVNPIVINSFGSDVTIGGNKPVTVSSIVMEGASAGDTATFIDNNSVEVLRLSNAANGASKAWKPAKPFTFTNGLIFDDSASSLATNDFVFIYLA